MLHLLDCVKIYSDITDNDDIQEYYRHADTMISADHKFHNNTFKKTSIPTCIDSCTIILLKNNMTQKYTFCDNFSIKVLLAIKKGVPIIYFSGYDVETTNFRSSEVTCICIFQRKYAKWKAENDTQKQIWASELENSLPESHKKNPVLISYAKGTWFLTYFCMYQYFENKTKTSVPKAILYIAAAGQSFDTTKICKNVYNFGHKKDQIFSLQNKKEYRVNATKTTKFSNKLPRNVQNYHSEYSSFFQLKN